MTGCEAVLNSFEIVLIDGELELTGKELGWIDSVVEVVGFEVELTDGEVLIIAGVGVFDDVAELTSDESYNRYFS